MRLEIQARRSSAHQQGLKPESTGGESEDRRTLSLAALINGYI